MAIVGFFGSFMYFLLAGCDINSVRDSFVCGFFFNILLRGVILIVCVIVLYVVYVILRVVLLIECVIVLYVEVWDPIHTLCPR